MFGTGKVWYGQIGYLMAKDLLGSNNGQLMPYFSWTSANYHRLQDQMNVWNVGVNWLIKGHNSKIYIRLRTGPYLIQGGNKIADKGQFVLQVSDRVLMAADILFDSWSERPETSGLPA